MTWQVAWWSLVPLALAAMTQPCGNVLGRREPNFRFYARSSPIICILDVADFLAVIALGLSPNRRVFARNVKYELMRRFEGEATSGDAEAAESTRLMRWFLLVLGGVACQTVKLVAMEGIPWTKTWGLIHAISIVFGEVLSLFHSRLSTSNRHVELPKPSWRQKSWALALLDSRIPTILSVSLHSMLVTILIQNFIIGSLFSASGGFEGFGSLEGLTVVIVYLCAAMILIFTPNLPRIRPRAWPYIITTVASTNLFDPKIPLSNGGVFVILGVFKYVSSSWRDMSTAALVILYVIEFQFFAGSLLFGVFPQFISSRGLQRIFQVSSYETAVAATMLLLSFAFSLLYYGILYESTGTVNPAWTGVFGK